MQLLGIALGGAAVGLSLGLLGGGGALLTVPLLLAMDVEPRQAMASSLLAVATTAGVAAVGYARAGSVDWRTALAFGPATALGGFAGGRAAGSVDADILLLAFAGLVTAAAAALLRPGPSPATRRPRSPLALAGCGAAIGALAGLLGAGGGFLFVPALALFGGLPMRRAVATSLVVVAANALAALAGHLGHLTLRPDVAVALAVPAGIGAAVGVRLSPGIPERGLRTGFALLLLAVAAWMVARSPLLRLG